MTEPAGTAARASDRLRAEARADWDAAVTHPFVRELCAGTLRAAALRRYLVQDFAVAQERCQQLFTNATRLELRFFEATYS